MGVIMTLAQMELLNTKQLRLLGDKVTIFTAEEPDDEYHWGRFQGKVKIVYIPRVGDESWGDQLLRIQFAVKEKTEKYPSELYTGLHRDNDMSRTYFWDKGWHICNRTGDYAVVKLDCSMCDNKADCSMKGESVAWCAEFSM
jgi:hypothetical protein